MLFWRCRLKVVEHNLFKTNLNFGLFAFHFSQTETQSASKDFSKTKTEISLTRFGVVERTIDRMVKSVVVVETSIFLFDLFKLLSEKSIHFLEFLVFLLQLDERLGLERVLERAAVAEQIDSTFWKTFPENEKVDVRKAATLALWNCNRLK